MDLDAKLSAPARAYHLRQLKSARAEATKDAEQFGKLVTAIENLGKHLAPKRRAGLGDYEQGLRDLARYSVFSEEIPAAGGKAKCTFAERFAQFRRKRNDAIHEGAYARNLVKDAAEVAIVLEDALSQSLTRVAHIMVEGVVVAEPWQPVSLVRQVMLLNSFSFIPILLEDGRWHMIPDYSVAGYLSQEDGNERHTRLGQPLQVALQEGMRTVPARLCHPDDLFPTAIGFDDSSPTLVVDPNDDRRLLGLVAPFDLM